jgi:hypothetical protein
MGFFTEIPDPVALAPRRARVSDEIVRFLAELLVVDALGRLGANCMHNGVKPGRSRRRFLCRGAVDHVLPA